VKRIVLGTASLASVLACGAAGGGADNAKAPIVVAVEDAGGPKESAPPKTEAPDPAERERTRQADERDRARAREMDRLERESSADEDPARGSFTLVEATAGLPGTGPLVARIKTTKGDLECKLYDDKAPISVANFVGLARGLRPWKDPRSGAWVTRPAYDGTTFHRVIPGFMIQGGDPKGNGTGEPGYVIPDERWPGAKHDRAGLLCAANRGANTNGMQFFVTAAKTPHLDDPRNAYTIFGECEPTAVVTAIAAEKRDARDKPLVDVVITTVEIARAKGKPAPPPAPKKR
jgi:peptidyl-prolyl cis-trans isomerase A (cyclophilin A)